MGEGNLHEQVGTVLSAGRRQWSHHLVLPSSGVPIDRKEGEVKIGDSGAREG